ncbi:MAG TPA: polysaccharide deacetylase family protein [Anditalea sp.]|nr:polysaccharide deacetylase family protein [Anditalea sp.]
MLSISLLFLFLSFQHPVQEIPGTTSIQKWPDGKKGAITLTYDDGSVNQFRVAMPIMDSLGLPGTFYIVTGGLDGSVNKPQFIGRPIEEILAETASVPTNRENFFERASAVGYLPYSGTLDYHYQAGTLFEQGKVEEAYRIMDEAYALVRKGTLPRGEDISNELAETAENTWDEFRSYAKRGHEFGSHTITHPRLAVLDKANLLYELEKSREDIQKQLGAEHTFSAEGPFGTEDERVMEYAYEIYPALRNRMPHDFLEELNRSNRKDPGTSDREYVQWQRGPLRNVPMETMKSWVDQTAQIGNIWLVLVFHGVDGIGWEPRTGEELKEYFSYIKSKEKELWIATFKDVTKYIRERMAAKVNYKLEEETLIVTLTHSLEHDLYDYPLTLKTYIPEDWVKPAVKGGKRTDYPQVRRDDNGSYIIYQAIPNKGPIYINP